MEESSRKFKVRRRRRTEAEEVRKRPATDVQAQFSAGLRHVTRIAFGQSAAGAQRRNKGSETRRGHVSHVVNYSRQLDTLAPNHGSQGSHGSHRSRLDHTSHSNSEVSRHQNSPPPCLHLLGRVRPSVLLLVPRLKGEKLQKDATALEPHEGTGRMRRSLTHLLLRA